MPVGRPGSLVLVRWTLHELRVQTRKAHHMRGDRFIARDYIAIDWARVRLHECLAKWTESAELQEFIGDRQRRSERSNDLRSTKPLRGFRERAVRPSSNG